VKSRVPNYGVWKKYEKNLVIFQPGIVLKKVFGSVSMKKNNLLCCSFDIYFHNILFKIDSFIYIMLNIIIVPVFAVGSSYGKSKSRKSLNLY